MEQLKIGELERYIQKLKKLMPKTYKDIKVFIGDDDELNGIHCAWYSGEIKKETEDIDEKSMLELLEERNGEIKDKETIFLIS